MPDITTAAHAAIAARWRTRLVLVITVVGIVLYVVVPVVFSRQ